MFAPSAMGLMSLFIGLAGADFIYSIINLGLSDK
jgi:hypothetical protein